MAGMGCELSEKPLKAPVYGFLAPEGEMIANRVRLWAAGRKELSYIQLVPVVFFLMALAGLAVVKIWPQAFGSNADMRAFSVEIPLTLVAGCSAILLLQVAFLNHLRRRRIRRNQGHKA